MLKVLLTIDTETHPIHAGWREDRLASDMKRDLYGRIDDSEVGLEYQLKVLARQELRASFMVESLFAAVPEVGAGPLREIVQAILSRESDVQLHVHPEWVPYVADLGIPYRSHLLRSYPAFEQEAMIRFGSLLLEKAGAPAPVAFRAGGFAADSDTLVALARCGIRYDSSYNRCFHGDQCRLPMPLFPGHATDYDGVQELPVAAFEDYLGHYRPAQVCACSTAEMLHALERAEAAGWEYFVIVSHTFEMITRRRHATKPPVIRWEVVERFERLCEFLGKNRHRFETVCFSDLERCNRVGSRSSVLPDIRGKWTNTVSRVMQQAVSRMQTY